MSSYPSGRSKSHRASRLPGDEHTYLQNRAYLESHFRSSNSSSSLKSLNSSRSSSSSRTQAERLRDSELRYATRSALSQSPGYSHSAYDSEYESSSSRQIPSKYQDEYERMMREDDITDNTDQYKAATRHSMISSDDISDMMGHMNLYDDAVSSRRVSKYKEDKDRRPISLIRDVMTPMQSQFDWDSSDDEEGYAEVKKKGKLLRKSTGRH